LVKKSTKNSLEPEKKTQKPEAADVLHNSNNNPTVEMVVVDPIPESGSKKAL
jgi:hypothetical protein